MRHPLSSRLLSPEHGRASTGTPFIGSKRLNHRQLTIPKMRSIIALTILLALVLPSMALSPVEQAYMDGVKEGLKLGQMAKNIDQYNTAIQQFNDQLNQTYGTNASLMWLPKIATDNTAPDTASTGSLKPVHKMDGSPSETTIIQY
jgi:hypothetical protein